MTPEKEQLLDYLEAKIVVLLESKFRKGDQEHKNDLMDKTPIQLLEEVSEELIDGLVYVLIARRKLKGIKGTNL